MSLERVEEILRSYEPAGPPSDLQDRLMRAVRRQDRARVWRNVALGSAAVLFVVGAVFLRAAERAQEEAARIAAASPPTRDFATNEIAYAQLGARQPLLTTEFPGAAALLAGNGAQHE